MTAPTPLAMWMTAEAAEITDDCPIFERLFAKHFAADHAAPKRKPRPPRIVKGGGSGE